MKKLKPLRRKYIGSDGKLVNHPTGVQSSFTIGQVHISKLGGYPGHDIRTHVPDTHVGEFQKMGVGRYIEEPKPWRR